MSQAQGQQWLGMGHLHGARCVTGVAPFHILHLVGIDMLDGHLLQLLHLNEAGERNS